MSSRIVTPTGKGFLLLDSHPAGAAESVDRMWEQAPERTTAGDGPVALVLGSSAGYGLAATLAGLRAFGVRGIGVCLEKAPTERRTATAGWYRTARTAELADGRMHFVNADVFADATKETVLEALAERFGPVDHLIYSVAAPRRTDPDTGQTYSSVLKPLGQPARTKTLTFSEDRQPRIGQVELEPATAEEAAATAAVMGGADWERWVRALAGHGLLADGFRTVALSYIGSSLTAAIYRGGTIGAAKQHLEAAAHELNRTVLAGTGGRAYTSVNGAAVTQASMHIPGIALYVSLLRAVLGEEGMHSPMRQSVELWQRLTGQAPLDLDEDGRIRLDRWELDPAVQAEVEHRWTQIDTSTVGKFADTDWFTAQHLQLYGFGVPGVDYQAPTETQIPWPA